MPTARERKQLNERLTDSGLRPRLSPETEQRRRDNLDQKIQKALETADEDK